MKGTYVCKYQAWTWDIITDPADMKRLMNAENNSMHITCQFRWNRPVLPEAQAINDVPNIKKYILWRPTKLLNKVVIIKNLKRMLSVVIVSLDNYMKI